MSSTTLWISDVEGHLKFEFEDESTWRTVEARIGGIVAQGGVGVLDIERNDGVASILINHGTQMNWRTYN